MTTFKIRDLMVQVLVDGGSPAAGCGTSVCPALSGCFGVTFPNCGASESCFHGTNMGCGLSVCPGVSVCDWGTIYAGRAACDAGVSKGCTHVCSLAPCSDNGCTGKCSAGCTAVTSLKREAGDILEDLAILRVQLRESLRLVDVRASELQESMRPQTVEEIQQLENKLTEALEDLRGQKKELSKARP